LVDHDVCANIGEFASLPCLYLLPHRLEVPLHPVHTYCDAVDERKRFRVLGKHGCKVSRERHIRAHEHTIPAGHRQTHALVMRVAQSDRETATCHLGFEEEEWRPADTTPGARTTVRTGPPGTRSRP